MLNTNIIQVEKYPIDTDLLKEIPDTYQVKNEKFHFEKVLDTKITETEIIIVSLYSSIKVTNRMG